MRTILTTKPSIHVFQSPFDPVLTGVLNYEAWRVVLLQSYEEVVWVYKAELDKETAHKLKQQLIRKMAEMGDLFSIDEDLWAELDDTSLYYSAAITMEEMEEELLRDELQGKC